MIDFAFFCFVLLFCVVLLFFALDRTNQVQKCPISYFLAYTKSFTWLNINNKVLKAHFISLFFFNQNKFIVLQGKCLKIMQIPEIKNAMNFKWYEFSLLQIKQQEPQIYDDVY